MQAEAEALPMYYNAPNPSTGAPFDESIASLQSQPYQQQNIQVGHQIGQHGHPGHLNDSDNIFTHPSFGLHQQMSDTDVYHGMRDIFRTCLATPLLEVSLGPSLCKII